MKREIISVEPLSTYLKRWKAPTSAGTRHGLLYPDFHPAGLGDGLGDDARYRPTSRPV